MHEAAASTVSKKVYGRPSEWIRYINQIFGAVVVTSQDGVTFAEMKATRDILEHARGIANATYREKAGGAARHAIAAPVNR